MKAKKNKAAQELGSLGGKARALALSAEERSAIARLGGKKGGKNSWTSRPGRSEKPAAVRQRLYRERKKAKIESAV